MKKLIETIKNIFKIEELRNRIGYTIMLLLIYRLGSFVVVPGIDPTQLANLEAQTQDGLMGLLNMFSGGAFGNASIFCIGCNALHLCINCYSIVGNDDSIFPETAARRRERKKEDESVDPLSDNCDSCFARSCIFDQSACTVARVSILD